MTRIRALAAERSIAVTHLPDRAGVSRSHFFNVMGGRKSPTLRWIGLIADALEVDAADLIPKRRP